MARRGKNRTPEEPQGSVPSMRATGGTWNPVPPASATKLGEAAIDILVRLGLSEPSQGAICAITRAGGTFDGVRLRYPENLIRSAIADGPKNVLLCGQDPEFDMIVGAPNAYVGTGGAAPNVMDMQTNLYRPSTLADLHAAARLTERLPNIHFFARSLVAGDISDPLRLDLATTIASLSGTRKHVMVQASNAAHISEIALLCHKIAGGEQAFRDRPFLSLNINHVVPPLRFHDISLDVMAAAVSAGIPVHCNVFGQLGASSPVTVAGSVAQTLAETLAGLAFVHALDPNALRIAGPRPMITDLRTGGMAGGAGEQVLATGVAAQVLRQWDVPSSVIAGATDSKLPDNQAGYEKALGVDTAIRAGANLVTQAAGTQAGLMAVNFAAMAADNEMLGAILRANQIPEISDKTISFQSIASVIKGDGHFLGQPETYARMKSDFLYPNLADRSTIAEWVASGATDLGRRADDHARSLLAEPWPDHLDPVLIAGFCDRYDIQFPVKEALA